VDCDAVFKEISLCYTTNSGVWQKRTWQSVSGFLEGRQIRATLPPMRPLVAFLAVKDMEGRHISSEHIALTE
jgi:hypothetical protein